MTRKMVLALCLAGVALGGCDKLKKVYTKKGDDKAEGAAAGTATATAKAGKESAAGKPATAAEAPKKPEMRSGAHILIAYKGARRADPKITRTKEEALKLAKEVAAKAKADPAGFAALAKKYSDGPSGARGGDLGFWAKGQMVPEFEKAMDTMKEGEVSDPVETPFGYHVLIRRGGPQEVAAEHLVVAFKGAMGAPPTAKRSKEEARKLAEKLAAEAQADPSKFPELVKKHSDGPGAKRGGPLGAWSTARPRVPPAINSAVGQLEVGQVSGPVETPFGFHILRRIPVPPKYAASHILVAYKGAMRADPSVKRSKEEAKKLAEEIHEKLQKDPKKFAELAVTHSDGPSKAQGGKLGVWHKGMMTPAFDEAVEKLKMGEISGPVETPFGFHIIKREDPAKMR